MNKAPIDLAVKAFKTQKAFEAWLAKHCSDEQGIWMRLFKKTSGKPSITYAEALDVALCYGWIDGQKQVYDKDSWIQRFTPRRARSVWSKRNTEHAMRLIKEQRMKSSGVAQIEAAKKDGRWGRAYDSSTSMTVPADFLRELKKFPKAQRFYKTLNKANTYAIAYRLQTAVKPETRQKRFDDIMRMMKTGKKFH